MRLAVLGDPVSHSLSPLLHGAALRAVGIPGSYEALRVDGTGMRAAVQDVREGRLDGANVTMPHKQLSAELVDSMADTARRIQAVNTLVRVDGKVVGHNTDIAGVLNAWQWAGLPEDGPVLILGAGGAAAAALLALQGREVIVASRRPEAAAELVAMVAPGGRAVRFGEPVAGAVVVNATPIGMHGESLPASVTAGASGLLDMASAPAPTPAVTSARSAGIACADGPEMLLGQAVEAFRLWTGKAPVAAMREALVARRAERASA